jgi:3-hydroxyacyl-CoA dehydrogenase
MAAIKKVAVIGAGVMGAGIAAQIANSGVDVLLLDIVPKDGDDRSAIAKGAIAKLLKTKPAPLMHKRNAKLITPSNIEDDLAKLADCDWVIEAVIERLDIKRSLYNKITPHLKKSAIISSNTSTIPLAQLVEDLPVAVQKNFIITHFFNPPRYLRLFEVVTSPKTTKTTLNKITEFADINLGKSVVICKDTPGFIGNRIGIFWLHAAVVKAQELGIDVETADATLSRPAGVPKTGVFGLLDLVGLDLMPHILDSMTQTLPKADAFQKLGPAPSLLKTMIAEGYTGRKGKGGFYTLEKKDGKKIKRVRNLKTGVYETASHPKVAAAQAAKKGGLKALLTHNSKAGDYAWAVLGRTLAYAAELVPEISDTTEQVDRAMRLGFAWKRGPFEMIDQLGSAWFAAELKKRGMKVPALLEMANGRKFYTTINGIKHFLGTDGAYHSVPRNDGVLLLEDVKRRSKPVAKNISASLWDIGDGVLCLEFHSKMNALDPFILAMAQKALKIIPAQGYKGLVIYNEGSHFSVGANIMMLKVGGMLRLWPLIRLILASGQRVFQRLKYAPFPVVGAPHGMALGGGCETLLHCHKLVAHAETYPGLVEVGVGIIPGWGGCKEMLGRWAQAKGQPNGPMPAVMKTFEAIATAQVGTSAAEAQDLGYLRPTDDIVMNSDRVLYQAKQAVLELAKKHVAPEPFVYTLPGPSGRTALELAVRDFVSKGLATPHDVTIAKHLANTLTGGKDGDPLVELSEKDILKLERDSIIALCKTPQTRARIDHILKTGKPLRN